MLRATARQQRNAPARLVSSTSSHCSSLMRMNTPSRVRPALLTSTSTRPKRSNAAAKAGSTEALFATSAWKAWQRSPPARSCSAAASARARLRLKTATSARRSARARTTACPMPVAPPVTNATGPASSAGATAAREPRACSMLTGLLLRRLAGRLEPVHHDREILGLAQVERERDGPRLQGLEETAQHPARPQRHDRIRPAGGQVAHRVLPAHRVGELALDRRAHRVGAPDLAGLDV